MRAGRDQAAQGKLADDAQSQHGGGAAQRQAGADRRAQAVARDARHRRFLHVELVRQTPQSAAFVAERQQLGGGVIAGIADAIARLPARHGRADGDDGARRAVAGAKRKLPVGQIGIFQPLMRAGPDGQLGAGADGADLGGDEDLIGGRRRQLDLADGRLMGFGDDNLACVHETLVRSAGGFLGINYEVAPGLSRVHKMKVSDASQKRPWQQRFCEASLTEGTSLGMNDSATPTISPFRVEPLTDFSRAEARRAMDAALAQVVPQLGRTYPPIINGQTVADGGDVRFAQSLAPQADRRPLRPGQRRSRRTKPSPRRRRRFRPGATPMPAKRADYLFRAAQVMRRRRFELAAWQVYECGKPRREADADVAESIDYCEFYGREMLRLADAATPRRARRGERLFLRAARRHRRHRAVELPAGHPLRHDHGRPRHRQHRRHEAGRAIGGHRRQADGGVSGGRLAARRRQLICRASARKSARRWSIIPMWP